MSVDVLVNAVGMSMRNLRHLGLTTVETGVLIPLTRFSWHRWFVRAKGGLVVGPCWLAHRSLAGVGVVVQGGVTSLGLHQSL